MGPGLNLFTVKRWRRSQTPLSGLGRVMSSVLIVEDEDSMKLVLSMLLEKEGYTVSEADRVEEAVKKFEKETYDLAIIDLKLGEENGIDVLKALKRTSPTTETVILTGYGSIESAVEAIKLGAFDYLTKPIETDKLLLTIRNALERKNLLGEVRYLKDQTLKRYIPNGLVVRSPKMQGILDMASKVARTDATVLIQGESGTGKELVARAIHAWSPRAAHPFIAIDCGTLPEGLFESELFGHVKGAFTGAWATKKGLFEEGNGGTIFLDEVEVMPPSTQVKLLRVLQDRVIRRVGGTSPLQIDIRILVATNQELRPLIEKGAFREDLYYRINGIVLTIPPLRERPEDIIVLASHFTRHYGQRVGRKVRGVSSGAMEMLLRHSWPGNVRELEKAIEHALVFGRSDLIIPEDLPPRLLGVNDSQSSLPKGELSLVELEKTRILAALHEYSWNQTKAAGALSISRTTLWRKLKTHNIRSKRRTSVSI